MNSNITDKRGVAIVMVIGLITIMMPVLFILSRTGTAQTKMAMQYHENLLTESTAITGSAAGFSRLRGNHRGYQDLPNEIIGDSIYNLNIRPTGEGFFKQDLYYLLANSKIDRYSYTLMAEAEQYHPEPDPPALVLTRDYWNTIEPYEINVMADVLSLQNYRGIELLRLEETRDFERNSSPPEYRQAFLAKQGQLPPQLAPDWNRIVDYIVVEKLN